jgi:hypothetical protein
MRPERHHRLAQQLRQLGDIGGDPPCLVAGEQLRSRAAARLFVEIDVSERLTVLVPDGETGLLLLDRPGRREAARRRHGGIIGSVAAGGAERSTATSAVSSYLMQINAAVRLHGP